MHWTIEQAMDAWDKNPLPDADPSWPERICGLLLGKVDLATVVQVLDVAKSAYEHGRDYELGYNDAFLTDLDPLSR